MYHQESVVSQSRTYVAVCNKINFDGHYFRKFTLPASIEEVPHYAKRYSACHNIQNNASFAAWYFLNVLDAIACIDYCITFEDYCDIKDVADIHRQLDEMVVSFGE